ncbi:MAG: TonB-dependent receptor domain-containing protein, partial [Bacteroidales bacterium]
DPDRNSIQMDIFPTSLIANMMVIKNFTADLPADFTGGVMNIETKEFPEEKILDVSFGIDYNPQMHFNENYLSYDGGSTDFLGFDDGTRSLPEGAENQNVPSPFSGASDEEVNQFVRSFNPNLASKPQTSLMDYSLSISAGNQIDLKQKEGMKSSPKLGYVFSLSYKNDYKYYDDIRYGEYQRFRIPENAYELRYATKTEGQMGERNVLVGAMAGIAYKTINSKLRLTLMHLQNGESRAANLSLNNDGEAVGQSGYLASSNNLEYNQRSLSNLFLGGEHILNNANWEIDWRVSPTYSVSNDPDLRKTAFTYQTVDTIFSAGAAGNPSRIWRNLNEVNATARIDLTHKYNFGEQDAKFKFGSYNVFKNRDYEILFYDIQFWGTQSWRNPDIRNVLNPENIYPNRPNAIYYNAGNPEENPNEYQSNTNNLAFYVSNEMNVLPNLKAILGLRTEYFVARHTGRDQAWAQGNEATGRNLDNDIVLESLGLFPSAIFILALTDNQNLRASYTRTAARPTFKELSFAQIIDPITNRIFNGSLLPSGDWDGDIKETRIDNVDLRWELFLEEGQMFSLSGFYKSFNDPLELVRIPEQQTSVEIQVQNVGDAQLYGAEMEFRKNLDFISASLANFNISGNFTVVRSVLEMTPSEVRFRRNYLREGETLEVEREMAGQAPYLINGGITYSSFDLGLDAGIFYNVKGPTLVQVGSGLYPDIYEDPFHSLNFSIRKALGADKKTTISFKASNLLDDVRENYFSSFRAENQIYDYMIPGRTFSLGVSHNF